MFGQLGRTEDALTALNEAVARDPSQFDPYQKALSIHFQTKNVPGALEVMERWLKISPNDPRVRQLYESMSQTGEFPVIDTSAAGR